MEFKLSPRQLLALLSVMNMLIYVDRGKISKNRDRLPLFASSGAWMCAIVVRLTHFCTPLGAIGSNGVNGSVSTDRGPGSGIQVSNFHLVLSDTCHQGDKERYICRSWLTTCTAESVVMPRESSAHTTLTICRHKIWVACLRPCPLRRFRVPRAG